MDQADLLRLAAGGLIAFPLDRLPTAVDWLHDYGEATGDGRYCSLARTLSAIEDWQDAQSGQMLAETVEGLDEALKQALPGVLDTVRAADAAPLARVLRMTVQQILYEDAQRGQRMLRGQRQDESGHQH